jgi:hypothetical protein
MDFISTFTAVFIATLLSQISIWIIDRYIKTHTIKILDKGEEKLKEVINGGKMRKINLTIERTGNGKYLVAVVLKEADLFKKADIEINSFNNMTEVGEYLEKAINFNWRQ